MPHRKRDKKEFWKHIFHIIICVFLCASLFFLAQHLINHLFPAVEEQSIVPPWVLHNIGWIPVLLTLIGCRKWLWSAFFALRDKFVDIALRRLNIGSDEPFQAPRTKWMQKIVWDMLLDDANTYTELASGSSHAQFFVSSYDRVMDDLKMLCQLDKIKDNNFYPHSELLRLQEEFQALLCDCIVREKDGVRWNIEEKYRNAPAQQEISVRSFEKRMDDLKERFTPRTSVFVDDAIQELKKAAGMYAEMGGYVTAEQEGISAVDHMDGHNFEYWCAALLQKCGYTQVQVTKGSGDQGVDITALKDEIRYAVQCKCYSSKLGNKPVQEVFAGKQMYGCQIGVVMTNSTFTSGAIELAENTGVLLWDRAKLEEMLLSAK